MPLWQGMTGNVKGENMFIGMVCMRFPATPPPHSAKQHTLAGLDWYPCFGYIRVVKTQAGRSSTPSSPRSHPLRRHIMRTLVTMFGRFTQTK